jgi:hypothetical protein
MSYPESPPRDRLFCLSGAISVALTKPNIVHFVLSFVTPDVSPYFEMKHVLWNRILLKILTTTYVIRSFLHIVNSDGLLPCSQDPKARYLYHALEIQSRPIKSHFKMHFNIIFL